MGKPKIPSLNNTRGEEGPEVVNEQMAYLVRIDNTILMSNVSKTLLRKI